MPISNFSTTKLKRAEITVRVPQGVGDIFWVWQKVSPYAKKINFEVIEPGGLPQLISRRSKGLIGQLPGVGDITYVKFDHELPESRWVDTKRPLKPLLDSGADHVCWAPNPWLEAAVPLEKIDPDLAVNWDTGVEPVPVNGLEPQKFLTFYVSGDAARHKVFQIDGGETVWPPSFWTRLIDRVCFHNGFGTECYVQAVGASFDYPILAQISEELRQKGFKVRLPEIDLDLPSLLWLFKNSRIFIGYQSGLSIIAEAAKARHHIVYFPRLRGLTDTWVRPDRRKGRAATYSYFDQDPDSTSLLLHVD